MEMCEISFNAPLHEKDMDVDKITPIYVVQMEFQAFVLLCPRIKYVKNLRERGRNNM